MLVGRYSTASERLIATENTVSSSEMASNEPRVTHPTNKEARPSSKHSILSELGKRRPGRPRKARSEQAETVYNDIEDSDATIDLEHQGAPTNDTLQSQPSDPKLQCSPCDSVFLRMDSVERHHFRLKPYDRKVTKATLAHKTGRETTEEATESAKFICRATDFVFHGGRTEKNDQRYRWS